VLNAAFYTSLFLDGRADSLETQALGPLLNPIEHGVKDLQMLIDIVKNDHRYPQQFNKAFNISPTQITSTHIAQAIASYERILITGDTGFDRYLYGEQEDALTKSEKRGLRIFKRKGNCSNCHEIALNYALFTDNNYYNIGVGFNKLDAKMSKFIDTLKADPSHTAQAIAVFNSQEQSELGRFVVTANNRDIGRFRTPTLRNVALTAPYMHDGSQATLEEVVEYYDKGGKPNPFLDPAIFPLKLSKQEKTDLVTFLQSLTSK
jgi:cytochrome c peroxidase